jgi:Flp pilus assembly protein TadD
MASISHTRHPTPATRQNLAQATALHNSGNLREAEGILRHILSFEADNPEALNLLGSIALRNGHPEPAIAILTRAAALAPRMAEARINLGHALKATSRLADAIVSYREAVRLKPRDAQTRNALGSGLLADGRNEAAEAEFREATRLAPRFAGAHNNHGHVLRMLGRPKDAEAAFRRALRLAPEQVDWHLNLALALGEQQKSAGALAALRDALLLAPDNVVALHAYGTMLVRAKQFDVAIPVLRHLRDLQPGEPDPFSGLAQALTAIGEFEEALALARETVDIVPDSAGARSNLGSALLALSRLPEAETEFEHALRLEPTHPHARTGRAFVRLREGRLEEAWDDYEARLEAQRAASAMEQTVLVDPATLSGEAWTGAPREGRSLLVYPEQGQGDQIQMVRYAALLAGDGPVLWAAPPSLLRLLSTAPGISSLLTTGDEYPPHDLHCSIMSLPRMFRTSLATIPGGVPYLRADPARTLMWRERLGSGGVRKIGLTWQGNPDYLLDTLRSIPSAELAALEGVRDTLFVSLQVPRPDVLPPLEIFDMTNELTDFADTAALLEALDLIITVDTSVAHLAGALGRPVWLLNRFNSDWRWMSTRTDSPWYPTMRIFRQSAPRVWSDVLTAVRAALNGGGGFGPEAA